MNITFECQLWVSFGIPPFVDFNGPVSLGSICVGGMVSWACADGSLGPAVVCLWVRVPSLCGVSYAGAGWSESWSRQRGGLSQSNVVWCTAFPWVCYAAYPGSVQGPLPKSYPAGPIFPSFGICTQYFRVLGSLSSPSVLTGFCCSCPFCRFTRTSTLMMMNGNSNFTLSVTCVNQQLGNTP